MQLTSIYIVVLLCDVSNYTSFRSVEIVITTTYLRMSFCTLNQFLLFEINKDHVRKTKNHEYLCHYIYGISLKIIGGTTKNRENLPLVNFRCPVLHANN